MKTNTARVLDKVFRWEGGWAQRDNEPGGAVNMGVSFTSYQEWRAKHKQPAPTFDDLKAMTREEAEEIYKARYFKPVHFDVLPGGVDYCVADFAVNAGVGGALRAAQKALGFPVTGKMDPKFLWALKSRKADDLITIICDARLAIMMARAEWEQFGAGWKARVDDVRETARKMADEI